MRTKTLMLTLAAVTAAATAVSTAQAQQMADAEGWRNVQPDERVELRPAARFTLDEIQRRIAPNIQAPFPKVVKAPKSYPDTIDIGPPPGAAPRGPIGDDKVFDLDGGQEQEGAATAAAMASCPPSTNFQVRDNFLAATDTNTSIPPDTTGSVGPNHLVTTLNTDIVIRDRAGALLSVITLDNFFSIPLGGNPFDPRVAYDQFLDRWIIIADANAQSSASAVYLAVSDTNDPTGGWAFYSIDADSGNTTWADYPGLGYNEKWLALTNNMFTFAGSFTGVKLWVIEKTPLASGTLVVNTFSPGFDTGPFGISTFTMKPVQSYDVGAPDLYCVSNPGASSGGTPVIRISAISGPENAPAWSQAPGSVFDSGGSPSGFFLVDNTFDFGVPSQNQLGSPSNPDAGDRRISASSKLQNGMIYMAHAGGLPVGGPDRAATFWYELDPTTFMASGDAIVQSGVLEEGPGSSICYPSIAANCAGEIVVGFSRSNPNIYIQAALAYRTASDPLGTLQPIETIKLGEDSYIKDFGSSRIRWGDYSETVLDPTDDRSLWTIQEYAATDVGPSSSSDRWGIWWARVGGEIINCVADITTVNTNPGDANYGQPDGIVDGADLAYYVEFWVAGDLAIADITTVNTNPGDPQYGTPDGIVDGADLSYFVEQWLAGCN